MLDFGICVVCIRHKAGFFQEYLVWEVLDVVIWLDCAILSKPILGVLSYEPADIGCVIYSMSYINFLNFYYLNVCMVCVM